MNGLLLDTHVFLWYASDDPILPEEVKRSIENEPGSVYVNSVSLWEIAIKHGLQKLELPQKIEELFELSGTGIVMLVPSVQDY